MVKIDNMGKMGRYIEVAGLRGDYRRRKDFGLAGLNGPPSEI